MFYTSHYIITNVHAYIYPPFLFFLSINCIPAVDTSKRLHSIDHASISIGLYIDMYRLRYLGL